MLLQEKQQSLLIFNPHARIIDLLIFLCIGSHILDIVDYFWVKNYGLFMFGLADYFMLSIYIPQ